MSTTAYECRPAWAAWFWRLVLTLGVYLPIAWWQRQRTRYVFDSGRVEKRHGLLSTRTDSYRTDAIKRIEVRRSLGDKLLGTGTLIVDTGEDDLRFGGVPDVGRAEQIIHSSA